MSKESLRTPLAAITELMEFEEEAYLYLDFQGQLDPVALEPQHIFFRMVDVNQEMPLVQLGTEFFAGSILEAFTTYSSYQSHRFRSL